jgi:2-hydroxychromene-2-carboxylate isomerase
MKIGGTNVYGFHPHRRHGFIRRVLLTFCEMSRVEFLFDFSSPNCYVALKKLQLMKNKLDVSYTPVFLGGLFKMTDDAPVPVGSHEFNYMERNLKRLSALLGVPFHFPRDRFPVNSLRALRGYYLAESTGKGDQYVERVFRACWGEDRDISDPEVLDELVSDVEIDPKRFHGTVELNSVKLKLREDTKRAFERGVFGAPTFFVDGELYWGTPEVLWFLEKERFSLSGREATK